MVFIYLPPGKLQGVFFTSDTNVETQVFCIP